MTEDDSWLAERDLGVEHRIRLREVLYEGASPFQRIQVVDTAPFGRALVLDGLIQTAERDEFIYHEMLAHPALTAVASPRRALIVGGGDGGCLRRALEHPLEEVVQVELDRQVVEVCQKHLPAVSAGAFADPRTNLIFADGFAYAQDCQDSFDAIFVDSTDPLGPSVPLYSQEFYQALGRILQDDGFLVIQSGSPFFMAKELLNVWRNLRQVFPLVLIYLAPVPSYIGTVWSFALASKGVHPLAIAGEEIQERLRQRGIRPRFYSPESHFAAFAIPPYLRELLASAEPLAQLGASFPIAYP
ncbi:MAG TPA: polyamine aminopropyltransferase [Dehalococcoidia bacterium]|nr:polyamine aminopropyltransferase [Dehalococcoidia bacterium]